MNKPLDEEDKNLLKLARAFEPMLRSEGWHYYKQILEAQKATHNIAILSAITKEADIYAGERTKGTVVGINLALNTPETVIKQAEAIRKSQGEDPDGD